MKLELELKAFYEPDQTHKEGKCILENSIGIYSDRIMSHKNLKMPYMDLIKFRLDLKRPLMDLKRCRMNLKGHL